MGSKYRMYDMKNACKILVRRPEHLGHLDIDGMIILKFILKKQGLRI
jgi:hypothetical protein